MPPEEVVITGVGVVSPIGIGKDCYWQQMSAGRSGVGPPSSIDLGSIPVVAAGEVRDFDAKKFVTPRKNLKVMVRDSELGVAASVLACQDAGLNPGDIDPERFGVVLGADRISGPLSDSEEPHRRCIVDGRFDFSRWATEGMSVAFPLAFLKVLPNMIASHVSIAHDARGPNNTIHQGDVSGLLAMAEATRLIQRGMAEAVLAGGASSMLKPYDWVCHCVVGRVSMRQADPESICRPFDAERDGEVKGEGAALFVLESRRHAEARGAAILARILGCASSYEIQNGSPRKGEGLRRAIGGAMREADIEPRGVGHVNAHGASTIFDDEFEARVIRATLGDVPVTAPKSYFGNLGAAAGAAEIVASVMSFQTGVLPVTLNYCHPDPRCAVRVVHGEPWISPTPVAVAVNMTRAGQAVAIVLSAAE